MSLKKDLTDIGYLLITPVPKKFRFEGVNYRRAAIQLSVGGFALQVGTIVAFTFGPVLIDKIDTAVKEYKKNHSKK